MAHEHGPHTCYCPSCGATTTVDEYVRCNTQTCPECGATMRATETGEYRQSRFPSTVARKISAAVTTTSIPCPICQYPIPAPTQVGERVTCVWCGGISEAIQDITIPNTVLVGFISFGLGAILGPAFWQAVKGGATALERMARERIK